MPRTIIIIGAGEVGFHIARRLSEEGQDVVLIDKDPEKIRRINENLDIQANLGSGTSPRLLKECRIETADMLVAATDSDEVNLISCLLARNLNPHLIKIARVRNPEYMEEASLFGQNFLGIDRVINPELEMAQTILNLTEIPGAAEVISFVGGRIKLIGMTVPHGSPVANRRLSSFRGPEENLLVGAIVRGDQVIIPRGEDTIRPDDLIYVVVRQERLKDALRLVGIREEPLRRAIIIGAGQAGSALARALDERRVNVKIIDRDAERCARLAETLDRVLVIKGDGSDKALLEEENVSDADFVIAITGEEDTNVLISLLCKKLGAKRTITRVSKSSYVPILSQIGIDSVVSSRLSAVQAILRYIRRGKIVSVVPLKGEFAEAIEAEALETSDIVNTPLSRVKFPKGAIVGALVRGEEVIIPRGDTIVQPKDRLIIFALQRVVPKIEKLLTVKLEYF